MVRKADPTTIGARPENRSESCARLIVALSMAGGLLAGGGVIAAAGILRAEVTYLLLGLVPPLFALGALAGFILGAATAWLARPAAARGRYRKELSRGIVCGIPGLCGAALITFWIAYPTVLASAGRPRWIFAAALGWIAAMVVFVWAMIEGWKVLRHLARRWFGHQSGLVRGTGLQVLWPSHGRRPSNLDGLEASVSTTPVP